MQLPQLLNDSKWAWTFKNAPTSNFYIQSPSWHKSSLAISCSHSIYIKHLPFLCRFAIPAPFFSSEICLACPCCLDDPRPQGCQHSAETHSIFNLTLSFLPFCLSSLAKTLPCKEVWEANQSCHPARWHFALSVVPEGLILMGSFSSAFVGHRL